MASVGHIAVGLAAARAYDTRRVPRWTAMAAWSALAMLPDLDVIGFALGVQYGEPWGHRGAAHSLLMAVVLGAAATAIARRRGLPLRRTALFTVTVLASHGLLDTMTDGGLGSALLWPLSLKRFFAPWRPIPVAPIGLDFLSPYGATVSAIEFALFGPLFVYALRPRRWIRGGGMARVSWRALRVRRRPRATPAGPEAGSTSSRRGDRRRCEHQHDR